jgi:hypothetical protein
MIKKIRWEAYNFDFNAYDSNKKFPEEEEYEEEEDILEMLSMPTSNVMQTQFGLLNIDDRMNPMRMFQFYLGETNFNLGKHAQRIINDTAGVEFLSVETRYRFYIAIGRCFNVGEVKHAIQVGLCGKNNAIETIKEIDNEEVMQHALQIHLEMSESYKNWAMYIFPNGEIEQCFDNVKSQPFIHALEAMKRAKQMSKGILITSENEKQD